MSENRGANDGNTPNSGHNEHQTLYHWVYVAGYTIGAAFIDFRFLWPESHGWALLALPALLSLPAIYELTKLGWTPFQVVVAVVTIFGLSGIVYGEVGPIPTPEAPTIGWLYPADEVSARTACKDNTPMMAAAFEDPSRSIIVALGYSGAVIPYFAYKIKTPKDAALAAEWNSAPRKLLRIGSCDVLSVRRTEGGLAVTADVVYPSGNLAAKIRDNQFTLFPPEFLHSEYPDKSTLLLKSGDGNELFWIRYLNGKSVKIRGFFSCKGSRTVHIAEDEITVGGTKVRAMCDAREFPTPNGVSIKVD